MSLAVAHSVVSGAPVPKEENTQSAARSQTYAHSERLAQHTNTPCVDSATTYQQRLPQERTVVEHCDHSEWTHVILGKLLLSRSYRRVGCLYYWL